LYKPALYVHKTHWLWDARRPGSSARGRLQEIRPESAAPPAPASAPGETVARIHWLGKKRLAAETNAAYFMSIWNLPKAPASKPRPSTNSPSRPGTCCRAKPIPNHAPPTTNPWSPDQRLLRPLLDDLVQEESYLEARHATNQPIELAFAIRVNDLRAGLWARNLASVIEALPGLNAARAAPAAAASGLSGEPMGRLHRNVTLRAMDDCKRWAREQFDDRRYTGPHSARPGPASLSRGQFLVGGRAGPARAHARPGAECEPSRELPKISVSAVGDGENIHTRAEFNFSRSLPIELDRWRIPVDFIHDPVASFTAIRGIRPLLAGWKLWTDLKRASPRTKYTSGPRLKFRS